MSIEQSILKLIDFEATISEFARMEARIQGRTLRKIEFILSEFRDRSASFVEKLERSTFEEKIRSVVLMHLSDFLLSERKGESGISRFSGPAAAVNLPPAVPVIG